MTFDELVASDLPWPEKRQKLIDYPYDEAKPPATYEEHFVDWDLQWNSASTALARAVALNRLTIDQYAEVVDGLRAKS